MLQDLGSSLGGLWQCCKCWTDYKLTVEYASQQNWFNMFCQLYIPTIAFNRIQVAHTKLMLQFFIFKVNGRRLWTHLSSQDGMKLVKCLPESYTIKQAWTRGLPEPWANISVFWNLPQISIAFALDHRFVLFCMLHMVAAYYVMTNGWSCSQASCKASAVRLICFVGLRKSSFSNHVC